MKSLFVFFFLITSFKLNAWEIIKEKDDFYLTDKTMAIKEKVFAIAEKTPIETISLTQNILVLRYLESNAGTTNITQSYNCSVVNLSKKKVIAVDQLCKSVSTFPLGKKVETSAKFKVDQDSLLYSFEELSEKFPLNHSH